MKEHDDLSVTASDDIEIDGRSTSTATDSSITEQEQSIQDKSTKPVSPTVSKGPVMLLRRQQSNTPSTPKQSSPVNEVPNPSRNESGTATPNKESVDPSLLEAFANPMNRQYLLQLEETLNTFVTQSRL